MADAFDIIIRGGRVMDPETGFDQTCDVAIKDGTIARIGTIDANCTHEIDATGLIVAPGFLDIHAHGQSVAERVAVLVAERVAERVAVLVAELRDCGGLDLRAQGGHGGH